MTVILGVAGVLATVMVGLAGLVLAARHRRGDLSPARSAVEFKEVRTYLNSHRVALSRQALLLYKDSPALVAGIETAFGTVPVLVGDPTWVPERPVPLERVIVRSEPGIEPAERPRSWPGQDLLARKYWPQREGGGRWSTYDAAIAEVDPPTLFFDDECYRLMTVPSVDRPLTFTVETARYFDYVRTCEALAYELAEHARALEPKRPDSHADRDHHAKGLEVRHIAHATLKELPYRAQIGSDISALANRSVSCGVNTLTLCRDGDDLTFLMHQRDPHKVASAGGVYHVVPAGEFQPATASPASVINDLDLWKTIMREYAEELLGQAEDRSTDINYESDSPYGKFSSARRKHHLRVYYLGFVMDPLNLKGDILTACVFDRSCFSDILGAELSKYNRELDREGLLLLGSRDHVGISFDEPNVRRYLSGDRTLPAGAATLAQAWIHRAYLH